MSFLYNFGLSQEDERTEASALQLTSDDCIISIASAGDMPLSLAAFGAQQVIAIDRDPAQLALTGLKLAAVQTLSRKEAIGFLGYLPMDEAQRHALYRTARSALSPSHQEFWDRSGEGIGKGAIWAGRFERYVRWLRRLVVPLLGRHNIEALFECKTTQEQEVLFDQSINRTYLKWVFRLAFSPRLFSRRGMDPRSLAQRTAKVPLGTQYFGWFRSFCTSNLASDNYFLQLTLLGRLIGPDAGPAYLSVVGYENLRLQAKKVVFHLGDLVRFLQETAPASFNKAHLSNICDWMDQASFEKVMREIVTKSAPGGRMVWRFLHVDRALPSDLMERILEERDFGQELRRCDRYPFYTIVPAQMTGLT